MTIKFNQKRALKEVKTESAIEGQRAIANETWELIHTAKGADDNASQSLFELVAHCMANTEDNSKECKKAIQRFFAFSEYKNASDLKAQTGIDLTRKISHLNYASSLDRKITSYTMARAEYDRKPKAGKSEAGKENSAKASASAVASDESINRAEEINVQPPQMIGLLLEEFNKCSQMSTENQQKLAVALKTLREEIHKQSQQNLKVKKAA